MPFGHFGQWSISGQTKIWFLHCFPVHLVEDIQFSILAFWNELKGHRTFQELAETTLSVRKERRIESETPRYPYLSRSYWRFSEKVILVWWRWSNMRHNRATVYGFSCVNRHLAYSDTFENFFPVSAITDWHANLAYLISSVVYLPLRHVVEEAGCGKAWIPLTTGEGVADWGSNSLCVYNPLLLGVKAPNRLLEIEWIGPSGALLLYHA